MSRGFYNFVSRDACWDELPTDPRFPIARHMNWVKPSTVDTEYHHPEPDNYNRVVMADRPVECKFIEDNVFYFDNIRNKWWSVYYVPDHMINDFDLWLDQQKFDLKWRHPKPRALRPRRALLYNRKNCPELSLDERLYTMGYFSKFSEKYFTENDKELLDRLGSVRTEILL